MSLFVAATPSSQEVSVAPSPPVGHGARAKGTRWAMHDRGGGAAGTSCGEAPQLQTRSVISAAKITPRF